MFRACAEHTRTRTRIDEETRIGISKKKTDKQIAEQTKTSTGLVQRAKETAALHHNRRSD